VLDIAAEEVSKAYGKVVGNYKKHAKIPGFRAGKVPDSVVKRRYAGEIRKDVIEACCRSGSTRRCWSWA